MKWAKERDSLIAQTRAFVNSVIAWKADATPPSGSVQPAAIENTFAVAPAVLTETVEKSEAAEPTQGVPASELVSAEATVQNDVRQEIQSRVAAFQAHQRRFAREREAYFNSMLTKARSAIDGGDSDRNNPSA